MLTQGFTTVPQEPEVALLPTYPSYLIEEDHRDCQLRVTTAQPGSRCDRWPAVTNTAAITVIHNVTRTCNAIPCPLSVAGSGRGGSNHYPPVCIASPQPDDNHQRQAQVRRIQTGITHLLQIIDSPNRRFGSPVWEEEGDQPRFPLPRMQVVPQPPFLIAQQCGKLVLTTWGDIYEAPRCMWQQSGAMQGGAAWH